MQKEFPTKNGKWTVRISMGKKAMPSRTNCTESKLQTEFRKLKPIHKDVKNRKWYQELISFVESLKKDMEADALKSRKKHTETSANFDMIRRYIVQMYCTENSTRSNVEQPLQSECRRQFKEPKVARVSYPSMPLLIGENDFNPNVTIKKETAIKLSSTRKLACNQSADSPLIASSGKRQQFIHYSASSLAKKRLFEVPVKGNVATETKSETKPVVQKKTFRKSLLMQQFLETQELVKERKQKSNKRST